MFSTDLQQDEKPKDGLLASVNNESSGDAIKAECATSPDRKPKHVSSDLWERFKALERRTDKETKRSTEKRMKYLRKQIVETVQGELTHPTDRAILHAHDVKFGPPLVESTEIASKEKVNTGGQPGTSSKGVHWEEVNEYLESNKHLEAGVSKPATKTDLAIEEAISKGDYNTAEKLSDELAIREFGVKVAHAFDARNFMKRKKDDEVKKTARKRKKLNWGFEQKQRWEMKSNM